MTKPRILYESRLADAAPVASSTATGDFDVANLAIWANWNFWKPAAMPATVTVDAGAAAAVNYWALWRHNLGTQGATVELRKSNDNFSADDNLVDTLTPGDDAPFARYVTTADERYWQLKFTGASAPTIAIAAMGEYLELPQGLRIGFDPIGRMPMGRFNRSVKGNPLSRNIDYELWTATLDFQFVTWAFIRDTWLPAWEAHLKGDPFVFVWDSEGHPAELRYVNQAAGFNSPHHAGGRSDLKVTVEGLFS